MSKRRMTILGMVFVCMLLFIAMTFSGTNAVVAQIPEVESAAEVPVLNYHKVDDMPIALSVAPQDFEEQIAYLAQHGFHSITPKQLYRALKKGEALPENPVLITFDDGYLDNYENAYPILKKYGFTATFFVITDFIGKDPRFMNWDQIRQMQQDGFIIGSHTVNHVPLTDLPPEGVMAELTQSRDKIYAETGQMPRYLAYPTGAYNDTVRKLVHQAGYKGAFTVRYGEVDCDSNICSLERIPIFRSQHTFRSFYMRVNGAPILKRLGIIRN
ncbi:MAG: polysaccharide deacetylase family protein [Sporomusaceae bacterium]|nr:polysaccharide deacetylase family protein [Sporomusaceae bacterium]